MGFRNTEFKISTYFHAKNGLEDLQLQAIKKNWTCWKLSCAFWFTFIRGQAGDGQQN